MRWLLSLCLLSVAFAESDRAIDVSTNCDSDSSKIFKYDILLPFTSRLATEVYYYSNGHFIISPHTIWLSLASLVEATDYNEARRQIWEENLFFPNRRCLRDRIYKLALGLEVFDSRLQIQYNRNRALAIDMNLKVDEDWIRFSYPSGILEYLSVPYDDMSFERVQDFMGIEPRIPLTGHSVFLDRLDFETSWYSAFADSKVTEAPFYNLLGEEIATNVDYFTMNAAVRIADIPDSNIRVLELPVGTDEYTMVFAIGADPRTMIETVFSRDILSELVLSEDSIPVAIPRIELSSGLDLRPALDNVGLGSVFTDADVTSFISEPAALPMGYLQRIDVNITGSFGFSRQDGSGLFGFINDITEAFGDLFKFGNDGTDHNHYHFVANRPFLFALYEINLGVPVFTGVYSHHRTWDTIYTNPSLNIDIRAPF